MSAAPDLRALREKITEAIRYAYAHGYSFGRTGSYYPANTEELRVADNYMANLPDTTREALALLDQGSEGERRHPRISEEGLARLTELHAAYESLEVLRAAYDNPAEDCDPGAFVAALHRFDRARIALASAVAEGSPPPASPRRVSLDEAIERNMHDAEFRDEWERIEAEDATEPRAPAVEPDPAQIVTTLRRNAEVNFGCALVFPETCRAAADALEASTARVRELEGRITAAPSTVGFDYTAPEIWLRKYRTWRDTARRALGEEP